VIDAEAETGVRFYSREYCLELFPEKWEQYKVTMPWAFVTGGFAKALEHLYGQGFALIKILGESNLAASAKILVHEDRSFDLPLALNYSKDKGEVTFSAGSANNVRICRQSETREHFASICTVLGFPWEPVAMYLGPLLNEISHEGLHLALLDGENAKVMREAHADQDEESFDLRIRIKA